MIMLSLYTLLLFTDFVPSPVTQYHNGWVAILLILFHLLVNLSFMIVSTSKQSYRYCRKNWCPSKKEQKKVKIEVKQEPVNQEPKQQNNDLSVIQEV